jgi:hypothetical protein
MAEQSSPLADEAGRLLGAVAQWARETFPAPGPDGQLAADCQWCPVCQLMAVLRGERPDVTERVSEAGTALLSAVRSFVDSTLVTGGGHQHPHPYPPDSARPASTPRVQHIDLGGSIGEHRT